MVFAVVVIGGMGSILGAIVSGFALGVIEGLTKVFYAQGSATVIFVVMAIVLLTSTRRSVRKDRVMSEWTMPARMESKWMVFGYTRIPEGGGAAHP